MARTLIASDSFSVASNTNLESHAGGWAPLHTYGPGFAAARASDDVAYCPFAPGVNDLAYRWAGAGTFSAEQYCKATIGNLSNEGAGAGNGNGVLCRASADTGANRDYYSLSVADDNVSGGVHTVRLQRIANGTTTTLYSASRTYTNGDTIELEVTGTGATVTLKMFQNGAQFGGDQSDSDATRIVGGGKPGLVLRADATTATLDDWEGGDVTAAAPTLTAPTGAATGNTTANAGATIDAVSGSGSRIMYALARVGGSPALAVAIKATGTQLAVTSAGAKSVPLTGRTGGVTYSADIVYSDATLGDSNVVTSTWTQPTAAVLSAPTNTPGSTTALIGATTTVSSGTAYYLARVGGSAALDTTIIATGQTSTVTTTTPSRTVTGLTASTTNNFVDIVQVSGVTTSNVVSTAAFTTTSSGDTTPPTLTGSIVIGTVTSSSIQYSWSAGSDNIAVTSYEVSKDGGSNYVDAGNVLTYTFTGLTASTSYPLRVRAKDAAGNVSTPALAATQSTAAASGVGSISLNNAALYTFKTNNGTVIASTGLTFYVHNVTTGALIGSAITGLSTNASGVVTTAISNASMLAGAQYRLVIESATGKYGSIKLTAV